MEREKRGKDILISFLLAGLVFQNVITPVVSRSREFSERKNHHSIGHHSHKKPPCSTPSHGGSSTPSHGSCGGGYGLPTPFHGGGGGPSDSPRCNGGHSSPAIIPPPSVTPSHGSGGSYGYNPPSSGGSPTIIPSPSSPPVESPVTPPGCGYNTPTPSHGGSGYDSSPPTPAEEPPSPIPESPYTPTPTTPEITPPSPWHPFFTGTCDYWRTHTEAILALLGFLGNIAHFFGPAYGSAFGRDLSLPEALANTRTDGIGALYREGTASLLNSLADRRFPFTTQQVKDAFAVAVTSSDRAAATQAEIFKQANEGRLKF